MTDRSDPLHDTGPDAGASTDEPAYAEALAELESILRELEGADVDVDRLADRVARAATLIAVCRDRIGRARLRIEEVVADLDPVAADQAVEQPDGGS